MKPVRVIDTNLIVRYLVQDNPRHAKIAGHLFEQCERGELTLRVLSAVLTETVFVLESFYEIARADIARALSTLIFSPGIVIDDCAVHADALTRYATTSLHFIDCLIASHAAGANEPVATFDRDFKRFADVVVRID